MHDTQRDEDTQKAAKSLFDGTAPERNNELEALWSKYGLCFQLSLDNGPDGFFVLEGGLFKFVRFNHRAMRAFWLAGFIAWEGYERIHAFSLNQPSDFCRFNKMIDVFFNILKEDDPSNIPMPYNIPEPGIYLDHTLYPELRAPAELATFSVGWALLHEIHHVQHQQEGTGAPYNGTTKQKHTEELYCDSFATTFMLEKISEYKEAMGSTPELVYQKRQLGIYFALFAISLITAEKWAETETHPALQIRIDNIIIQMEPWRNQAADAIAGSAFAALQQKWPFAPSLAKAIERWA